MGEAKEPLNAKQMIERVMQIMNLRHLTPDIQAELLFLPRTVSRRDSIHEKLLRSIAAELDWGRQRGMWDAVRNPRSQRR